MKSQQIPEHKMNFTGGVGQALEKTADIGTNNIASKKAAAKQVNTKDERYT
ncbi:hypothetical protein [Bacillus sp. AFS031507]|uniref:hypothetical protein n=1 Tax=Bacillus sp. AFS031507 TaxID=2033496 RepID=UPI0015D47176|nr:hypothetical protein [Bacillus sp. AFS031507]